MFHSQLWPVHPPIQIEAFRALEDEEGHPLTHNFRPIQPLGDRVVLFNTDEIIKDVDLGVDVPPSEVENSNRVEEDVRKPKQGKKGKDSGVARGTPVESWVLLGLASMALLAASRHWRNWNSSATGQSREDLNQTL